MPLITLAYLAGAAGLLLGFGGAIVLAAAVAATFLVGSVLRGSSVALALGALFGLGALLAVTTHRNDVACAREAATRGVAIVRLNDDLRPRHPARGVLDDARCRTRVRLIADGGTAAAGSVVRVVGLVTQRGDALAFTAAHATLLSPPGVLARWRAHAGHTIDQLYGAQAPLARALLIADERDIAPDVRKVFADAGIIHMLSVSGLHVAVLAEATALALLLCGAGVRRAELLSVAVTVAFVLFVGAPAPAVRAGAMYTAVVASRWVQRPTSPWALLSLGAVLPLGDPRVVLDIGYQLSVVGMAGLVASGALARRIPWPPTSPWLARVLRELLATVVATAVTAPIVSWHFGRLSLAAPITNLAVSPLFAVAQPALFLSLVLSPFALIARFTADGTGVLLAGIGKIAVVGAAIPGAALNVMPSAVTAIMIAVAATALIVACVSHRWARPTLVGAGVVAAAVWWPLLVPRASHVELHMIDVGQGDALALRTPRGRWIVVDAGDAWRGGDAGARTVAPYLRHRGGDVAALILSHAHSDHIGGAQSLLRLVHVGAVYDGALAYSSDVYDSLLESARRNAVPWRIARAGDTLDVDGVRLFVLGPDSATAEDATDPNAASVVVLAEYRGVRMLLTGDAEHEEEARMLNEFGSGLSAQILKAGHHGSATSSGGEFLDAVHPRVALVSVGTGNHYGHPSPDVLQALAQRGVQVFRTDEDGSVVVSTDGRTLRIRTDESSFELSARGKGSDHH